MKKLIWIFGEFGAGKKTLVKNILEDKDSVRELFDIDSSNIDVIDIPLKERRCFDSFSEIENRINSISRNISNDNEIILIIGYSSDTNILGLIAKHHPSFEKEILFLNPSDGDVLYDRLTKTEWFMANYKENSEKYPRFWLNIAVNHMRKNLYACEEFGYKITEVDTSDGYEISNQNDNKLKR